MKTRIVLLCCSSWLLALPLACTEAERCELGQAECEPDPDQNRNDGCATGTSLEDGICVDDDDNSGGGSGGSGGSDSGSGGGRAGGGGSGGSEPEPVDCPEDSVDDACQAFCEAYCQNQELLCVESRCSAGDCESDGEFVQACATECEDDVDCAHDLCLTQIDVECKDFGFTDSIELQDGTSAVTFVSLCDRDDPVCVPGADVGCSNLCGTTGDGVGADLVDNGTCEDGGEGSVSPDAPLCNRGTDCIDCGVRVCSMAGGTCSGHGDCCGFYEDGAFCVELSSGPTCLETCTESRTCPDDLRCLLVDDEENRVCAP